MTYRIYRTNGTDRTWFSVGGDLSSVALAKEDPGFLANNAAEVSLSYQAIGS